LVTDASNLIFGELEPGKLGDVLYFFLVDFLSHA
jgi:hypothetical protein